MFPPAGWDVDALFSAIRAWLSEPMVTGVLTLCYTVIFGVRFVRWFISLFRGV